MSFLLESAAALSRALSPEGRDASWLSYAATLMPLEIAAACHAAPSRAFIYAG